MVDWRRKHRRDPCERILQFTLLDSNSTLEHYFQSLSTPCIPLPGCAPNTMNYATSSTDHCFTTHCTPSDSQHQLSPQLQPLARLCHILSRRIHPWHTINKWPAPRGYIKALNQCNPRPLHQLIDGHHVLTETFHPSFSKPARLAFILPFWVQRHLIALKVVQCWPTYLAQHMRMIPVQFCQNWLANPYTDNLVTCWCYLRRTCLAFQNWWTAVPSSNYSSVRSISCGRTNISHLVSGLMHWFWWVFTWKSSRSLLTVFRLFN